MKPTWHEAWQRAGRLCARVLVAALAVFALNGCETVWPGSADIGPVYHPSNFYRSNNQLAAGIRRVAVLPLTAPASTESLDAGLEALEPVLQAELGAQERFEIVPVSSEDLHHWTGRTCWQADEALPEDLFERLREATGCDAVLFSQLTLYRAYPPVAVGWKFCLAKCTADKDGRILWSADEIVDSGAREVARGARAYYSGRVRNQAMVDDPAMVLYSPLQFGRYSLAQLLDTLPAR